jgi:hypothetical protein
MMKFCSNLEKTKLKLSTLFQNENAPLPYVFKSFGWTVAEYIVSFGAIFGMLASLFGAIFREL